MLANAVVVKLHVGRDLRHAHRTAGLGDVPEDAVAGGIAERTRLALQEAVGVGVGHPTHPVSPPPRRSSLSITVSVLCVAPRTESSRSPSSSGPENCNQRTLPLENLRYILEENVYI